MTLKNKRIMIFCIVAQYKLCWRFDTFSRLAGRSNLELDAGEKGYLRTSEDLFIVCLFNKTY